MKEVYQTLLTSVDKERIYQHIRSLEGPRFPLDNMDKLNDTADYIREELHKYGVKTITNEFSLEGFSGIFQNIEAHIGDESQPAIVLCSHYDTVEFCPGANDNLSGVAICLEITRILAQLPNHPHVIANFFTLEEGHPVLAKNLRDTKLKYSIIDEKFQFTKVKYLEQNQIMIQMMLKSRSQGSTLANGIQEFIKKFKDSIDQDELKYYEEVHEVYRPFSRETYFGNVILVGSNRWVENAVKVGIKIKGVINFDTVAIIKQNRFTQSLPPIPRIMLKLHKTNFRKKIANFTLIAADKNSKILFQTFLHNAKKDSIDLPFVGLRLPLTFPTIAKFLPDLLRADHAPFWQNNIPAIFLTDTANLRWDGYHTKSDEAKYLNYEIIVKICKTAIAAILDL